MPRLKRPLDPKAVAAANAAVAGETGGRQLTMEPKDAALRKKWVAAYLAAGGKEAKNFNAKPVKKSVQICPKTNWIEVEYLYADDRVLNDKSKGIKGAVCIVTTPDGAELARATTDQNGFARIDGLPNDITTVNYCFDKDPPKYEVFEEFKPNKGITWEDVKDVAKWIGGALAGDFNEDQSIGQIVVGTVITLIPVVDQIGDIRDIVAAVKKLVFDKRYDEAGVWFDLVITIIGCIPEVGTVIKGVLKSIKKSEKGVKLAELLRKLNWAGKGNAVQWLKKLSGDLITHGKKAAAKIKKILDGLSSKLETVKKVATETIAKKIDEILDSIKEVRKRVDNKVDEIINDLKKRLDEILAESGEKLEKKGNTQKKNTLKQEKESLDKSGKSPDAPKIKGTKPTGTKGGKPGGKKTVIGKKEDPDTVRSLTRENETADKLADKGYKVEQNPKGQGTKNPDYKIEGEFFDCYSPKTSNPRNIVDTVSGKVGTGQANRVVLNLADSDVPIDALKKQLADNPIQNLEELMVLTKDGKLVQLFP